MANDAVAFWSYAHADDSASRGRIRALASHVEDEYSLLTGKSLRLFVDRKSIEWGDAWRERIDSALLSSTAFIPIITPRYFDRDECRKELLGFYGQSESRGLARLILPIQFSAIANFSQDNPDEAVRIAARAQFEDWSGLRLKAESDPEYLETVNRMAQKLVDVLAAATDVQAIAEQQATDDGADSGFAEVLARIKDLLPPWLAAIEEDQVQIAKYKAVDQVYSARLRRARATRGGVASEIAITHRLATEELPFAERARELALIYVSRTIEMHPIVLSAIRTAEAVPEVRPALAELKVAVDEALVGINAFRDPSSIDAQDYWRQRAHLGVLMRQLSTLFEESTARRVEANAMVMEWAEGLQALEIAREPAPPNGAAN